ncbi:MULTISPECIES: hypothetical protein [Arthrobacter]|uniref:Uncharacterized protein n=1 Tax=Arthrobacter caoxuetaonis TaxID=2886935 RepID=A0A9X1MBX7_9MICC|nr:MULTISPECIES: hypothetical protein [Arthrobacter]MCC3283923.1 hypothetical protein [Arthrobacter caoxuetaonis]MCC3297083.1 hypothetical protein [Arthrobacter caoxuetaonis]MCC9193970.1 hypothetical protein [Arthrobacter sp. zg-Y916]USQ58352.1 hypothetical protein NF551_05845 [Arthrobacter caoxuetaonis]
MDVLWIVLGLAAAAAGGWPLTSGVLKLARAVEAGRPGLDPSSDPAADQVRDPAGAAVHPLPPLPPRPPMPAGPVILRGGLVIGFLERLAVAAAVLADEPVAIAYVVAVKGLGRYAELKETPAAAERFIIGTLTSMLWAVGVAAAVRVALLQG